MKKIISLVLSLCLCLSSVTILAAFDDVDNKTYSWAYEAIEYLTEQKVLAGYGDGSFRPDADVTRAEFAKMLSESFKLNAKGSPFYSDISSHWAEEYIKNCSDMIYSSGVRFEPDNPATRADIAYGAAKAIGSDASDINVIDSFTDSVSIAEEMRETIASAVELGLVIGYEDGSFRPEASVTRAEAAVIIYRALEAAGLTKDDPDAELPSQPVEPDEEQKPEIPEEPDKPDSGVEDGEKEHIYTLYPCRDLILVSSVSKTNSPDGNGTAYKLKYKLANSEEEYSSVIPEDVTVKGQRTDLSQIKGGDVLIMDTSFHGYISYLYVLACFDSAIPQFDGISAFSRVDDYSIVAGKLSSYEKNQKVSTITLQTAGGERSDTILNSIDVNIYSQGSNADSWIIDGLSALDTDKDVYVLIRYTNDTASDIIISDIK